jgi:phage regulator Rha-like protein
MRSMHENVKLATQNVDTKCQYQRETTFVLLMLTLKGEKYVSFTFKFLF